MCDLDLADAPVIERILTPRIALTVAEHLTLTAHRSSVFRPGRTDRTDLVRRARAYAIGLAPAGRSRDAAYWLAGADGSGSLADRSSVAAMARKTTTHTARASHAS